MYETRLKPSWKALERNEMPSECQERICFPDLIPIAKLLAATSPADLWLFEWEDRLDDFGLGEFKINNC